MREMDILLLENIWKMTDDNITKIPKDLEEDLKRQGYRKFVCPNLELIEIKGKELNLDDKIIKNAEDLAIRYIKKTYHTPRYSSIKYLLASFIYIASILDDNRVSQRKVAKAFRSSATTIRKWNDDIIDVLELDITL